jgi:hypothetical protein
MNRNPVPADEVDDSPIPGDGVLEERGVAAAQDALGSSSYMRCDNDNLMMMSSSAAMTSEGVWSSRRRSLLSCVRSALICAENDAAGWTLRSISLR